MIRARRALALALAGIVALAPKARATDTVTTVRPGIEYLYREGFGQKIPKGYVYSAILFSVFVEALNIRAKKSSKHSAEPVHLHEAYVEGDAASSTDAAR